jgi:hypothetical protein
MLIIIILVKKKNPEYVPHLKMHVIRPVFVRCIDYLPPDLVFSFLLIIISSLSSSGFTRGANVDQSWMTLNDDRCRKLGLLAIQQYYVLRNTFFFYNKKLQIMLLVH